MRAAFGLFAALAAFATACHGGGEGPSDAASYDAAPPVFDICDAFSGVGTTCPLVSPVVCFPECEAGGCYCSEVDGGARWTCVIDRSCMPACAPIEDACATDAFADSPD